MIVSTYDSHRTAFENTVSAILVALTKVRVTSKRKGIVRTRPARRVSRR